MIGFHVFDRCCGKLKLWNNNKYQNWQNQNNKPEFYHVQELKSMARSLWKCRNITATINSKSKFCENVWHRNNQSSNYGTSQNRAKWIFRSRLFTHKSKYYTTSWNFKYSAANFGFSLTSSARTFGLASSQDFIAAVILLRCSTVGGWKKTSIN